MFESWAMFALVFLLGIATTVTIIAVADHGKMNVEKKKVVSITRTFFITTQIFAIIWVCWSYVMATYSMLHLGVVYTLSELSDPAIRAILGVNIAKVAENIFEHNEGSIFGQSDKKLPEG